jgi:hypothetical protein
MFAPASRLRALAVLALGMLLAAPALAAVPALPPAPPAQAEAVAWSNERSPAGGPVQSLAGDADVLVASHWYGGTYRSTDGGAHWQHIAGFPDVVEARVAWDPTDGQRGYVAGFGGFARTTDGGLTWEHVFTDTVSYRVAVGPSGRVLTTIRDADWNQKVMSSTDGGATWRDMGAPLPQFTSIYGLEFGRTEQEVVVMSISRLWYTHDDGATWTQQLHNVHLDLERTEDGALWRAADGLQRSLDGGATWSPVDTPGDPNPVLLGARPGGLLAASSAGIMATTDGGATWTWVGFPGVAFASTSLSADPRDPQAVFVTHENLGILRIAPDGQGGFALQGRTAGLPPVEVRVLGGSADGSILLAGSPFGLYASRDGGMAWEHTGQAIGLMTLHSVGANHDGSVLYAGGNNAIFQNFLLSSRDGGKTWTGSHFDVGGDSKVVGIATPPDQPLTAWIAVQPQFGNSRVFETQDGGLTWTQVHSGSRIFSIAHHAPTSSVLAGTIDGVKARDALGQWTLRSHGDAFAVSSAGGSAYAAGEALRLWRSVPLGLGAVFAPHTDLQANVLSLAAFPDGTGVLAGTNQGKVLRCPAVPLVHCADLAFPEQARAVLLSADGSKAFAANANGVWTATL